MVLAGEPSGDLHGARLLKEIRDRESQIRVTGIGGDRMIAAGMEIFFHIDRLSVMGATEVLRQAGTIKKAFDRFKQKIRTDRPNLLVFIDYPGFNLKAAAFARRHNIPVLYYIAPKVWAWNPSRLKQLKKNVDHVALIFHFEEKLFKKKQIPCTFVGHPLLDGYDDKIIRKNRKKSHERYTIGLLPGSREAEISALLETMLKAAELIAARTDNIRVLISQALCVQEKNFRNIVGQYNETRLFTIVKGDVQTLFQEVDCLIAASGTVTLEAAICRIPMVIVYKVSAYTYVLAKKFVKLKHVGLANIIAGHEVVPEFLQNRATPENIAAETLAMMNGSALDAAEKKLSMIKPLLGGRGASKRTAHIVLSMLKGDFTR